MSKFNEIINSETPVLVDFYADWCAPCKMMTPILKQVSDDMGDEVKILKVNVDNNQAAAAKYGVRSIPTLMIFQNGKVQWQNAGVVHAVELKKIIKSVKQ